MGSGSWGGVVGTAGGGEAGACARGVRELGLVGERQGAVCPWGPGVGRVGVRQGAVCLLPPQSALVTLPCAWVLPRV